MPQVLCLLIIVAVQVVVAFFGYNLVHLFERCALPHPHGHLRDRVHRRAEQSPPGASHHTVPGAFLLVFGASFGYAVGWNPYAADYTRYFKPDTNKAAIAWWSGRGLFLSCALLEIVGAAVGTAVSANNALAGPGGMTSLMATPLADLTLLAIALGAVSANVLNIYSGALSFTAIGIKLPLSLRRAIVALGFGTIGFFLAWNGLSNVDRYENFLLIIAYWIGPGSPSSSATSCCGAIRTRRCCSLPGVRTGLGLSPCSSGWASRSGCSATRPSTSVSCPRTSRP